MISYILALKFTWVGFWVLVWGHMAFLNGTVMGNVIKPTAGRDGLFVGWWEMTTEKQCRVWMSEDKQGALILVNILNLEMSAWPFCGGGLAVSPNGVATSSAVFSLSPASCPYYDVSLKRKGAFCFRHAFKKLKRWFICPEFLWDNQDISTKEQKSKQNNSTTKAKKQNAATWLLMGNHVSFMTIN